MPPLVLFIISMDILIYSCSAQLISFEIESTSKETNCAEHEYINMSPSLIALATLQARIDEWSCKVNYTFM